MWFPDYWYGGGGDVNVPYVNFTFWMDMTEVCSRKWTGQFLPQRWQGGLVRELAPACHSAFKWWQCFEYSYFSSWHCQKLVTEQLLPGQAERTPLPHCKKRLWIFPARESMVSDIPAGDGKIINLFFTVQASIGVQITNSSLSPPSKLGRASIRVNTLAFGSHWFLPQRNVFLPVSVGSVFPTLLSVPHICIFTMQGPPGRGEGGGE